MKKIHQGGVIAPLLAAVLLGLLAVSYTLIFDNFIVAIETSKIRDQVEDLCSRISKDAPIHRTALEHFNSEITDLDDNLPSWVEILSATLTMGTMPTSIGDDNCSTSPGQPVTNLNISSLGLDSRVHFQSNLCDPNFASRWGTLNVKKNSRAGIFIGCEVKTRIRTYFSPSTVSAGMNIREGSDAIKRARIVYSRFGFWKYLWTNDSQITNPQGLLIAIAPQIPFEPVQVPSPAPTDANQFREALLLRDNYTSALGAAPDDNRLKRKSGVPNPAHENDYLAAPFFQSTAVSNPTNQRAYLLRLFAGAPFVFRQRLSSAFIELASRDGLLRSNTAVLLANPRMFNNSEVMPPIILRNYGEDLRSKNLDKTPMLFTKYLDPHSNTKLVDPFYSVPNTIPPASIPVMYSEISSLISRFPTLGLHLDSSENWHRARFAPGNADFPFFSFINSYANGGDGTFSFEPSSFDWSDYVNRASEQFNPTTPDYFDRLNNFKRVTTGENTRYNILTVSQLARSIGASVKCPYQLDNNAGEIFCSGFEGFQPDIEGVLKAWSGESAGFGHATTSAIPDTAGAPGTRFNAVTLPGMYSPGYSNWGNGRNPELVLFLNSPLYNPSSGVVGTDQITNINNKITSLLDANKLPAPPKSPITVIYIPTRNQDSSIDALDTLAFTFQANICAPTDRQDMKRGNVLIPFIHDSSNVLTFGSNPKYKCIQDVFPCTKAGSLQGVWDCLLTGNTPESTAKQIFNETLTLTSRIF